MGHWVSVLCFVCSAWADPVSITPTAPLDPATFTSLRREDFAAGRAEVHAVFVSSPSSRMTANAVHPYPGHPPIPTVEVQVAVIDRPVVLVLGSHASVHWRLEVPPGARVEKVIAQGYYQQFVSGLPTGVKLLSYYSHPPSGVDGLYLSSGPSALYNLFENVRRLTGVRPSSLQTETREGRVLVDGVTTVIQPGPETAFEAGRPVTLALVPMSGSRAADELSARFCCEKTEYTTGKATRAFAKGRIYFEATILLPEGRVGEQTNVGLLSVPASSSARLLGPVGHLGGYGVPLLDRMTRASLRDKDVVGVAGDLDAARAYVHVNGNWVTMAPNGWWGRGIALRPDEEYVAAVSLTPDLRVKGVAGLEGWRLNFGATPFRHSIPRGYTAYAAHGGGIEAFTSMRNNEWNRLQELSRVVAVSGPRVGDPLSATQSYSPSGAIPPGSVVSSPGAAVASSVAAPAPETRAKPAAPEMVPISSHAEVHAVGVYHGGPGGISIKVTRSGPVVLVLMAYEPVVWRLDVASGAVVERVVTMGHHAQQLQNVPANAETISWSYRANRDPRNFLYYGKPEGYDGFQRHMKAVFGREASSFQGAYRATEAVVDGTSRELAPPPKPIVLKCGRTTIVCGEGQDRVICGGREILCGSR